MGLEDGTDENLCVFILPYMQIDIICTIAKSHNYHWLQVEGATLSAWDEK